MKDETGTVTVGHEPTKYEERTKILYPLSREIADTLVGRGLNKKKVYQWFNRQAECPHERPKPRPDLAVYRKNGWIVIKRDTGEVVHKSMNDPSLQRWMDRHNISENQA